MPLTSPPQPTEKTDVSEAPVGARSAALRFVRRLVVLVFGISVVLAGIVMIVTPGPAVVVIPLGLAILATEFLWARRLLDNMKHRLAAGQDLLPDSRLSRWLKRWLPKRPDVG